MAKNSSSSSSSSASSPLPPEGEGEDGLGARFYATWRELLQQHAHQSAPLMPRGAEAPHIFDLITRYPDPDWLALITEVYVRSEDKEIRKGARCLGSLRHWAGECEAMLRRSGRKPASECAA